MGARPGPSPSFDVVATEAHALVASAKAEGIGLRLVGSLGVRSHCPATQRRQDRLGRTAKDIDLVCRRRDRHAMRGVLERHGFEVDRDLLVAMEGERYLFRKPEPRLEVDVFVDPLDFCHKLSLGPRLEQHPRSIPLEELLLHKLQIVEPTIGDYADVFTLLLVHDVVAPAEPEDPEVLHAGFVAATLATDWGFHHTACRNLDRVVGVAGRSDPDGALPLSASDSDLILARVERLRAVIERHPKTLGWKARARIGERLQWWQDVDAPRAVY